MHTIKYTYCIVKHVVNKNVSVNHAALQIKYTIYVFRYAPEIFFFFLEVGGFFNCLDFPNR